MRLAAMFSDHAVLQRERQVAVWGWTKPGVRVQVLLGEAQAETFSGTDGRFLTWLPPMPAGGPFTMEVRTSDPGECAVVQDVLVGEVWLCSGQSNMEWPLCLTGREGFREMLAADYPRIRTIMIPRMVLPGRQSDASAAWQVCHPDTAGAFTAVGYYFARVLQERLGGIPVGLINASWGGTRIEAWISRESLVEDPEMRLELERCDATSNSPAFWEKVGNYDLRDQAQCQEFQQRTMGGFPEDSGNRGVVDGWAREDFSDAAWPTMALPSTWQNAGHEYSGVLWFRRQVDVPAGWAGRDLLLGIGAVDKTDITYFNGEQVGATGQGFEQQHWNVPRVYRVPGRLVKKGINVVAVRAYSFIYHGGLIGPKDKMELRPEDAAEGTGLTLSGEWRFAVEQNLGQVQVSALQMLGPGNAQTAGILFDNMIAPVVPYGLRGALWYQGESNTDRAARYRGLLPRLIRDWRHVWAAGDFPFLIVQLANHQAPKVYQANSTWAVVREAQMQALALPATGMAVTIDIGEETDIHPKNKRDVGHRLAQWALTNTYGQAGVPCGPLFSGATIERGGIRVRFLHVGGGLVARGGALRTFVMAGANGKFLPAEAVIQGDTVWVSCPEVTAPLAVRYAWADNPDGANLYNAEGFPAAPFRSDAW
ncbi:MAG: hypothetical protein H7831_12715 [Magnetococcus sp. WYHC-3]